MTSERRRAAVHEADLSIVVHKLGARVKCISIVTTGDTLAAVAFENTTGRGAHTIDMCIAIAGIAADRRLNPSLDVAEGW